MNPKYCECWTGQALIAEAIGHDEAMDLFRHTTELGNNVNGRPAKPTWTAYGSHFSYYYTNYYYHHYCVLFLICYRQRESQLGYGHWVLTMLLDVSRNDTKHYRYSIEKMNAVTVSCDALGRLIGERLERLAFTLTVTFSQYDYPQFLELWPSANSLNAFGLLLERQGLLVMAAAALRHALTLAAEAGSEDIDLYRSNMCRVLWLADSSYSPVING